MREITHLTAIDMRRALDDRALSVVDVVQAHLKQIEAGAPVNAVVTVDPEGALARARELDAQGPDPELPLFGLPIGVKDTHDTSGLLTTYGSIRHRAHVPPRDAAHVRRMREAGAVIVGKTNVPEYAAGSHTVNRVFGPTRNPYALDRSAGGSSGGAAAALAARQVALADGSDMGGSLRNPASFCNVVGLRPSPGIVPAADAANLLSPLTTAGPMGRTVDDVALLLSVIGRPDPRTPSWASGPVERPTDGSLRGVRVGWAPTLGGRIPVDSEVLEVLEHAVRVFADAGAEVVEACPDLDGATEAFLTLRAAEFEAEWGDQLARDPEDFNDRITWNIERGRALSGRDVMRAQEQQTRIIRAGADFFSDCDVLLSPVAQVAPFPVTHDYPHEVAGQTQRHYLDWMRAATAITMLGVPAISVPAGFTAAGLPVGLQIASRIGTDARLLGTARIYEALTDFGSRAPVGA